MTKRLATLSAKKNDEQRLIRRLEEKAGIKSMEKWEETPSWPSSKTNRTAQHHLRRAERAHIAARESLAFSAARCSAFDRLPAV